MRHPERIAIVEKGGVLTFGELEQRANHLAWQLATIGVQRESMVALLFERSREMVVTMLAIWKAGAAYVPLDPAYPSERLHFILEDAKAMALIGAKGLLSRMGATRCPTLAIDRDMDAPRSLEAPVIAADPCQLAYVIYTSGSTGRPKGVAVEHRNLLNLIRWHQKAFQIGEESRATMIAGTAFDASVWEVWPHLTAGAVVHIPDEQVRLVPESLQQWLLEQGITITFLPTVLAERVLQLSWAGASRLRTLLTGGDKLHCAPPPGLPFAVVNNYGPTENAVVATSGVVTPSRTLSTPTLGRPIDGVNTYILDSRLEQLPVGEAGEVWISGESLARGYVHRPSATAERFQPNPFGSVPGDRMYRTGDMARWLANGEIEFLGRCDDQVKIRGFRVELGEIESVLLAYPAVRQAAVLVRHAVPGEPAIVAYITPQLADPISRLVLWEYLRSKLPEYMIPAAFVLLAELPLSANGKLDRQRLPAPVENDYESSGPALASRTATEEAVARIWSELLGKERISVLDDFFVLGGHSLLATQMLTRIRNTFNVKLPFRSVFVDATVANIAALIDSARQGERAEIPRIAKLSPEQPVPLSLVQEQVWFLNNLVPGNLAYNTQVTVRFTGFLDIPVLEKSLTEIVRRHEIFRTAFPLVDGMPMQQVGPPFTVTIPVADLRAIPEPLRVEATERLVAEELAQKFDLTAYPLVRWKVFKLAAEEHLFVQVEHHFVHDGWSLALLMSEIKALYLAFSRGEPSPLPELKVQYRDFACWQRKLLDSHALDDQVEYWKKVLAGSPPVLALPADHARPAVPSLRGAWHRVELPAKLYTALKQLSLKHNATLFMVLLAAFKILILRYTREADVVIGTSIANRTAAEMESLIGMVVNMLVLRTDLSGNPTFGETVSRVREVVLGAYAHQDVPLHKLIEALQPERDIGRNPLFQVTFGFHDSAMPDLQFPGLRGTLLERSNRTSKFDLSVIAIPRAEQAAGGRRAANDASVSVIWEYSTDLFQAASIERMAGYYLNLLQAVVDAPQSRIEDYELLSPDEKETLALWARGPSDPVDPMCFHELFETQARRDPEAIAVRDATTCLSYRELDAQANRLASYLVERGVAAESVVGICLPRSAEFVVVILAVFKAGGAYLPLNASYPRERIRFMLQDAKPLLVLAHQESAELFAGIEVPVVLLDHEWRAIHKCPAAKPATAVVPFNLAYIIYTSGSTGSPKCVLISHHGFANLSHSQKKAFDVGPADRVLQIASTSFDTSIFEIALALLAGGTLVMPREEEVIPGPQLVGLLDKWGITTLTIMPSALMALPVAQLPKLRNLIVGGEAVPGESVARWAQGRRFFDAYGPTEVPIWATWDRCQATELDPSIGRPISNLQAYIMDNQFRPVPANVPGDLYLGSDSLARGYLNLPDLTAEKFVPNPWDGSGARMYKTGDIARFLPDGRIEFLGRSDDQVKIRGFRIELGEIEAALVRHSGLENAVVVVREDDGVQHLVAYITRKGPEVVHPSDLKGYLRSTLPEHMIPAHIVDLDALPITSTGKVDRKRLLQLELQTRPEAGAGTAPRSAMEKAIAEIWRDVLRAKTVDVHKNFFDLGGHSLLLVQVQQRLKKELGVEVSFVELFRSPTVAALAERLGSQANLAASQPEIRDTQNGKRQSSDIAIVGMAGRFPGARNIAEFWKNLCAGREHISFFSEEEMQAAGVPASDWRQSNYVPARGVLQDADMFDAAFWGFSPREAEITDPQHRVFLECAWEALESAGCDPDTYDGRIGVYAGSASSTYLLANLYQHRDLIRSLGRFQSTMATDKDHVVTRTSYKLNLTGPSVAVNTACSSSLVAVHIACRSLCTDDCDMAIAGGVAIKLPQYAGYFHEKGGYNSPDGHCRAFDASAEGTLGGNGCALVVLKRLQDALDDGDQIFAIIKATAINNDGALKAGYTAPSVGGQVNAIRAALKNAQVDPHTIGYVEAHGTGTPLGDPIEAAALVEAYGKNPAKPGACAIGSVKTNIGHLDAAAGVTGLIKAALCLHERKLVPSLHFESLNPAIDFSGSQFYVNREFRDWVDTGFPRRCGVSSFGIGGTNAHAIVQEALPVRVEGSVRSYQLLALAAKTNTALEMATDNLAEHLQEHDHRLQDVAFTLHTGRKRMQYRRTMVCETGEHPSEALRQRSRGLVFTEADDAKDRPVVFLFPGQGGQQVQMARELYQSESVFRNNFDECSRIVEKHLGFSLKDLVYPAPQDEAEARLRITEVEYAQAALFALEYSLAQLWQHWGVVPKAMAGHSLGEYVAACIAGVFNLEDALLLVSERGRLMQGLPQGAMLSVALSSARVEEFLGEELEIGAINNPSQCMITGSVSAIEALEAKLTATGILCKRLPILAASHSSAMDPILSSFAAYANTKRFQEPKIPFLSNLTGTWITSAQATDPNYWVQHMRHTVRFLENTEELLKEEGNVLLEVGPGKTLANIVQRHPKRGNARTIVSSLFHPDKPSAEMECLLNALGKLWLAGVKINWGNFWHGQARRRVNLPSYPFERGRYWIAPTSERESETVSPEGAIWGPVWKQCGVLTARSTSEAMFDDAWVLFVDDSQFCKRVLKCIHETGGRPIVVKGGRRFVQKDAFNFVLNMESAADYLRLLSTLQGREKAVSRIVLFTCGGLRPPDPNALTPPAPVASALRVSMLADAAAQSQRSGPLQLTVVSDGMHRVTGEEKLTVESGVLLGACRGLTCRRSQVNFKSIDIALAGANPAREEEAITGLLAELGSSRTDQWIAHRRGISWTMSMEPIRRDGNLNEKMLRPGKSYLVIDESGSEGGRNLVRLLKENGSEAVSIDPTRQNHGAQAGAGSNGSSKRGYRSNRSVNRAKPPVQFLKHGGGDDSHPDGIFCFLQAPARAATSLKDVRHASAWVASCLAKVEAFTKSIAARNPEFWTLSLLSEDCDPDDSWFAHVLTGIQDQVVHMFRSAGQPAFSLIWNPSEARDAAERLQIESLEDLDTILAGRCPIAAISPVSVGSYPEQTLPETELSLQISESLSDAPADELQAAIAAIWQQVLGIERIGIHENFFVLGGDSLIAIQVVSRIRQALLAQLSVRSLFESPTIAKLASTILAQNAQSV